MIDWDRAEELRQEVGDEDFGEIVAMFLEEADSVLLRLVACDSAKCLESGLHFLKGSALNLGFSSLAQICQAGERAAAAGITDVPMDEVVSVYTKSRAHFLTQLEASAA